MLLPKLNTANSTMLSDHCSNQIECKYFARDPDICQQLLVQKYICSLPEKQFSPTSPNLSTSGCIFSIRYVYALRQLQSSQFSLMNKCESFNSCSKLCTYSVWLLDVEMFFLDIFLISCPVLVDLGEERAICNCVCLEKDLQSLLITYLEVYLSHMLLSWLLWMQVAQVTEKLLTNISNY